jgi:hypothetical protein
MATGIAATVPAVPEKKPVSFSNLLCKFQCNPGRTTDTEQEERIPTAPPPEDRLCSKSSRLNGRLI